MTKKSIFAEKDPDCRAIIFDGAQPGGKNMVKMAQAGNCYEDNPSDYAHFLGLKAIRCWGFNYNYFDCNEICPFDLESNHSHVYTNQSYTVFSDSKCQYQIKDIITEQDNIYIHKESPDLKIYHSYDIFNSSNVDKNNTSFRNKEL